MAAGRNRGLRGWHLAEEITLTTLNVLNSRPPAVSPSFAQLLAFLRHLHAARRVAIAGEFRLDGGLRAFVELVIVGHIGRVARSARNLRTLRRVADNFAW